MRTAVRLVGRVLGLTALAVALTGCLKLSQDLTLNPDDTVDGEITLAVSKELLELSGQSEEDAISSITEGDTPLPEGIDFETEPYDDGEFVGQTFVFSGAPLDRFSGEGGDELGIVHEGDTFVVSGNLDLSQGSEGIDPNDPTTQQLLESFDVQISVTFPGAVETANGEIDGNTVTWRPQFGENLEVSAVGSAIDNGGGGGGALLWILIGAAVVIIVVLVVVLLARRGNGSGGAEAPPAGIGFSPPGEAAAAAGAVGAPPAPVQPPATPLPVETQHTPAPPIPTDTAGSFPEASASEPVETAPEPAELAPEPAETAPEPVETAPEPPASDAGPSDAGSSDTGGGDGSGDGSSTD
ncbi:MAG TPA: hypothetical protein VF235_07260 [Actinomycetota bacterium]